MKKTLSIALIIVIVIGFALLMDYKSSLETQNSKDSEKITFQIKEGEAVDTILGNLVDEGLLRKRFVRYSKIYLKTTKMEGQIQAGTYNIPKNLSMKELITTLQNGKNQDVWVTIHEGLRKDEIAKILNDELSQIDTASFSAEELLTLTTDSEFIKTLELEMRHKGVFFFGKFVENKSRLCRF